nr:helix-turn-helix domain-containing protein [Sagittula salina]
MTPEEVAFHAELSRDTILAEARRGSLPARRVGMQYRFVPDEVARWIAQWR